MDEIKEAQTKDAAAALFALYGDDCRFLRMVLCAGWMTDAERRYFEPLVDRLLYELDAAAA
jgi:hypothetical protein